MSFELFPVVQWFDNNGNPLSGGLISTFAAGTTMPQATYTDSTGGTPQANPVVLDSAGRAQIWFAAASYKLVLKTAAGVTLMTIDNVTLDNLAAAISSLSMTGNLTLQQSTAATSIANQSSNLVKIQANYWNGVASAVDEWDIKNVLGSGTNPTSTLTFTHTGSPGVTAIDFPNLSFGNLAVTGNETIAGTLGVTGATSLTSVATSGNASVGGTLGVTGNTTLVNVAATGTETFGPALPATVNTFNAALHATETVTRSTTESAQPDHYAPILAVNYQPSGGTNSGGKTKPFALRAEGIYNSTGEHAGIYVETNSGGSGDNVGIETFAYYGGMADDNGGEACEGGRFQADATVGTVFTATLTGAVNNGSTFTLPYNTAVNEVTGRGVNRVCIRTDGGTYTTGTISSFSGTGTITATGSGTAWATQFGAGAHSDLYLAVTGDTVGGIKFVVPITSITNDTTMVLTFNVNTSGQSWPSNQTGAYTIYRGSIVSDVSAFGTVTVTNGYTGWANAQTIEMPIGYSGHMESIRALVNPGVPWGSSFPCAILHGINLNTSTKRRVWGVWFDSTFGMSRGIIFQNSWGADPQGNDSTGNAIDIATNPGNVIASRDNTNATNIFNNVIVGDVISYAPGSRVFGIGTTGAGSKLTVDPTTGNTVSSGKITTGASGLSIAGGTALTGQTGTGTSAVTNTGPTVDAPVFTSDTTVKRIKVSGTAPTASVTGAGAGATAVLSTGSTDTAGEIVITAGTTPAANGTLTLTLSASFGANAAVAVAILGSGGAAWNARATIQLSTRSQSSVVFLWDNNAVALVNTSSYLVQYVVIAR